MISTIALRVYDHALIEWYQNSHDASTFPFFAACFGPFTLPPARVVQRMRRRGAERVKLEWLKLWP